MVVPSGNTHAKPSQPVPPYVPALPEEFLRMLRGH
jgi:hypothetical protein